MHANTELFYLLSETLRSKCISILMPKKIKPPNKPRKNKTAGEGDRVYMFVCVYVKVLAV